MFHLSRTPSDRCPACGAANAACGAPSDVVGVDAKWEVAAVGGPLQKYNYRSASGTETVMKLNAADAVRYGLTDEDLVDAPQEPETAPAPTGKARPASSNKARSGASNKGAGARKAPASPAGQGDGGDGGAASEGGDGGSGGGD